MITGIIIALADELNSLTKSNLKQGDCVHLNANTLLCLSGAGPENAHQASLTLIKKGAKRLISWGCAAALIEQLKPGDLILPRVLSAENQDQLTINTPWSDHIVKKLSHLNPKTELLAESRFVVATSIEKKSIHSKSSAIALDMESIAIAKAAKQNNIPVVVIRAIADPVSMNLPLAVSHALDPQGNIKITKLLGFILTHPSEIPGLIKLGLHFNAAKNKLKLVANHLDIIVGFEQLTATK